MGPSTMAGLGMIGRGSLVPRPLDSADAGHVERVREDWRAAGLEVDLIERPGRDGGVAGHELVARSPTRLLRCVFRSWVATSRFGRRRGIWTVEVFVGRRGETDRDAGREAPRPVGVAAAGGPGPVWERVVASIHGEAPLHPNLGSALAAAGLAAPADPVAAADRGRAFGPFRCVGVVACLGAVALLLVSLELAERRSDARDLIAYASSVRLCGEVGDDRGVASVAGGYWCGRARELGASLGREADTSRLRGAAASADLVALASPPRGGDAGPPTSGTDRTVGVEPPRVWATSVADAEETGLESLPQGRSGGADVPLTRSAGPWPIATVSEERAAAAGVGEPHRPLAVTPRETPAGWSRPGAGSAEGSRPTARFAIQVAAVRDPSVVGAWQRLAERHPSLTALTLLVPETAPLGAGDLRRIVAGSFATREDASAACERLRAEAQDCLVVIR